MSLEHVVPFALGGSDDLTITTCKAKNNDLGSEIDAPFIDFFPVRAKRFLLGLESTAGNAPTLDLGGKGWIDGKEVPISYAITEYAKELKIARPDVMKMPSTNGEEWQISGDPTKVREILVGKLRQQIAEGKGVTRKDGTPLGLEDVEKFFAENQMETVNPSVLKTIHFDYRMSIRFFCKMALAMGHLHLGEVFSRSPHAAKLRRLLWLENAAEFQFQGASIWPETQSAKHLLEIIAKQDHHTLAIMDGTPPVLLISLFGEIGAVIPLGEVPGAATPVTTADGRIWRIKLPSRELTRFSMGELITQAVRARYPHSDS
jgi:hypothetical protein